MLSESDSEVAEAKPYWERDFSMQEFNHEAQQIARYHVDPNSVESALSDIPKKLKLTDENVSKLLSKIELDDTAPKLNSAELNFEKLPPESVKDFFEVALAKTIAAQEIATEPQLKSRFREFADKVRGGVSQLFSKEVSSARRKFLAASSMGILYLVAQASSPRLVSFSPDVGQEKNISQSETTPSAVSGMYEYEGKSKEIIDDVYSKYGIYIASFNIWKGEENLPWPTEAIEVISETLPKLPPAYFKTENAPKFIFLVRSPGASYLGVGGGSNELGLPKQDGIILYISEKFDVNNKLDGEQGAIYGDARTDEEAVIVHEFTHTYVYDHPQLETLWEEKMGWVKDANGNYTNLHPDELMREAYADKKPFEDFAVSVTRLFVGGPLSADRKAFLEHTSPWSEWQASP